MRTMLLLGGFAATTVVGGIAWGDEGSGGNTTTSTDTGTDGPTWREGEVVLTVDPSYLALPYARQALEGAILAWTATASELPVVTIRESAVDAIPLTAEEHRNDHRLTFAPEGEPRAQGALAITLVTVNGNAESILDADIIVNGGHCFTDATTYADTSRRTDGSSYDLQNVLTHEFGHWFGLGENYVNSAATMYAYVEPFETKKRDLTKDDLTAVQLAYWHADNPSENTGCAVSPYSAPSSTAGFGFLAVASLLLRRSNRRGAPHLPSKSRRHDPTTTRIGREKAE